VNKGVIVESPPNFIMRFGWYSASQANLQRTAFVYTLIDGGGEAHVTEVTRSESDKPKFADAVAVGALKSFVRTHGHTTHDDSSISVITVSQSPDIRAFSANGAADKRQPDANEVAARRRTGALELDSEGNRHVEDGHDAAKRAFVAVHPRTRAVCIVLGGSSLFESVFGGWWKPHALGAAVSTTLFLACTCVLVQATFPRMPLPHVRFTSLPWKWRAAAALVSIFVLLLACLTVAGHLSPVRCEHGLEGCDKKPMACAMLCNVTLPWCSRHRTEEEPLSLRSTMPEALAQLLRALDTERAVVELVDRQRGFVRARFVTAGADGSRSPVRDWHNRAQGRARLHACELVRASARPCRCITPPHAAHGRLRECPSVRLVNIMPSRIA
jgi:hypothetical protein